MILNAFGLDDDIFDDLLFMGGAAGSKAVEDTATGNPVTFLTDLAKPLKSLVANFLPVQSSGTPSPDNILPITGWDAVDVWHGGKNMFSTVMEQGTIRGNDGVPVSNNTRIRTKDFIYLPAGAKCTFSVTGADKIYVYYWDSEGNYDTDGSGFKNIPYTTTKTLTKPYLVKFVLKYTDDSAISPSDVSNVQVEIGDTATTYEAPNITKYPVSWSTHGTIYGGYVDMVTGEVWKTWEAIEKTWGQLKIDRQAGGYQEGRANFVNPIFVSGESGAGATTQKCNIAKYSWQDFDGTAHFYTAKVGDNYRVSVYLPIGTDDSTEVLVVCKLKSPVLITTLTPQQINAIKGNNTVWSDANWDCEVTYFKKG